MHSRESKKVIYAAIAANLAIAAFKSVAATFTRSSAKQFVVAIRARPWRPGHIRQAGARAQLGSSGKSWTRMDWRRSGYGCSGLFIRFEAWMKTILIGF